MKKISDYYGEYELTKICMFSFFPQKDDKTSEQYLENWCTWTDKYHPRHYFDTYTIETTRKDLPQYSENLINSRQYHPYYLYVPIKENNKDWYKNNKGCKYLEVAKRSKVLPVGVTQKRVDKWIEISEKFNMIIEKY